jgi:hypothetical protein
VGHPINNRDRQSADFLNLHEFQIGSGTAQRGRDHRQQLIRCRARGSGPGCLVRD